MRIMPTKSIRSSSTEKRERWCPKPLNCSQTRSRPQTIKIWLQVDRSKPHQRCLLPLTFCDEMKEVWDGRDIHASACMWRVPSVFREGSRRCGSYTRADAAKRHLEALGISQEGCHLLGLRPQPSETASRTPSAGSGLADL